MLRTSKVMYGNCIQRYLSHHSKPAIVQYKSKLNNFKINDKIHGFVIKDVRDVDFSIKAIYLEHETTKAEYLHLNRDDSNNLFSVNFRTTPKDSQGKPHILEHTVLCGSKLYPIRDPFFKMLNRSLATFMNAMTGSDFTIYPFSTQNYTDYINLQRVYLDAVFNPNLERLDFMQEGWRFENTDINDIKSQLTIKGIVYNEMKGVFSENENIFQQKLQNTILPDHTYGVVSGGDPMEIPNLTWEALKDFHYQNYNPSNCRCFSYGNFPLEPSLKYINETYFTKYNYNEPTATRVPQQKRWSETKREHIFCRYDPMGKPIDQQNSIAISLLLSDCTDIFETFVLQFITDLLVKGPNSSFYKTLIEPNFSGGFSPSTGMDTQIRDTVFTVGLNGVKKEHFAKVEEIFNQTIDDVIKNGFTNDHIESVLHSYELTLKHEAKNFGLHLLFYLSPLWNHTNKVIDALEINYLLDKLRKNLVENPKFIQHKVEKYFQKNGHKLILTMSPDKEYEAKLERNEQKMIEAKIAELNDEDKQNIFLLGTELNKMQGTQQDTNILPTLIIDDINSDIDKVQCSKIKLNGVHTHVNNVNSNGLIYFKGFLNANELPSDSFKLLPLFCYVMTKLGTDQMNYKEFDSVVHRKTSGLQLHANIIDNLHRLHSYETGIVLSSYALEKNAESMWDLWKQIFSISKLEDTNRLKMLMEIYMTGLTHGVANSGHIYAIQSAASLVSATAYQSNLLAGLEHISYMKNLNNTADHKALLTAILSIGNLLFKKDYLRVSLNISERNQNKTLNTYEEFVKNLDQNHKVNDISEDLYIKGKISTSANTVKCNHHILNIPVNYCSKAVLTCPYADPDHATLKVLSKLLTSKYLHPELREKRGAYGSGAKINDDGVFSMFSYRDPNSLETLDIFDNSNNWLKDNLSKTKEQDLLEAKLGVFQAVDAPIPPSSKGSDEFLKRLTPEMLRKYRENIILIKKKDLEDVAEKYLYNSSNKHTAKAILGDTISKDRLLNREGETWDIIDNV